MSRLELTDVEWRSFFIGGEEGIFNIQATSSGIDKNKLNFQKGLIPYITRSDVSNGINMFVSDNQNAKYSKDDGNVITIGLDTQTVFYQSNSFFTGQNIQVLKNEFLNKEVAQFIIPLIKIQMKKFNWGGNGATLGRLNRTKMMLPIDNKGNPNWQFMEDYIKQERKIQTKKIIDYYENKLLKTAFDLVGLGDVEWKEFWIEEIAEIDSGVDIYERERVEGYTPYITATSNNNGIGYFVSNNNKTLEKDCISVNRNGSVGYAFYHPYSALYGNDTRKLKPVRGDKYSSVFLSSIISLQREKYGYGYKMGTGRLKRQKIMLPIDSDSNPHWEYMSKFMQNIENDKLLKTIEYIYIYIYI